MSEPLLITSAQNPRLKELVHLGQARHRRERGVFLAEGWRAVERALQCGLELVELYECPELPGWSAERARTIRQLMPARAAAARFHLTLALMSKAAYCENPEGVLGVFVQPATDLAGLGERLAAARRDTEPQRPGHGSARQRPKAAPTGAPRAGHGGVEAELFLVIVGAEKPGNVGAMARTADAAGVAAMIVADPVMDLFNPNAIRASTGAIFALPVAVGDADAVRRWLQQCGVAIWSAAPPLPGRRALPHTEIDWRRPCAIVIGPEDAGLDATWLAPTILGEHGGGLVTIPMRGRAADSLNASVAAAVLLFEARRQRDRSPSP